MYVHACVCMACVCVFVCMHEEPRICMLKKEAENPDSHLLSVIELTAGFLEALDSWAKA